MATRDPCRSVSPPLGGSTGAGLCPEVFELGGRYSVCLKCVEFLSVLKKTDLCSTELSQFREGLV